MASRKSTEASRSVILTGAAGVLGRAMALALLRAGHRVLLTDIAEAPLRQFLDANLIEREQAALCAIDLTTPAGPTAIRDAARDAFGRVDMLINNAALTAFAVWPAAGDRPKPWALDMPLVHRFFEINVTAAHALISLVIPGMIDQGWGRVINVTSRYDTMQSYFPYGATKAALEAYTAALEMALSGSGVSASTVNPGGPVATEQHVAKNPGRKWVRPDVMNGPVLWLATEASNGVGGRRYVGARWDSAVPWERALEQASKAFGGFGDTG